MAERGIHLQLRPGTDTALSLGFLNVILGEGLHDKEFIDEYCMGFDRLKEHVKPYTPDDQPVGSLSAFLPVLQAWALGLGVSFAVFLVELGGTRI